MRPHYSNYVSNISKMNVVILVILAFAASSNGFLIKVPTTPVQPKISSSGWMHLQKMILPLFDNVCENSTDPVIVRLAQEFSLETSDALYQRPEVITNLKNLKLSKGFTEKGVIFTEYNTDFVNELRTVYEVLLYAKDFDTFYKAAAWSRQNLNCGLFVDAIYLAILNRRDTAKLSVPAPYEILPNYFINKDVIIKASSIMSGADYDLTDGIRDEGNSYILDANYTANYIDNDDESKLAYFQEDIGLNSYYYLRKLKNAPWFNTRPVLSIGYGEYLYHTMKQLTTRYKLERYANQLPEIGSLWETLQVTSYDPKLIYSDGDEFGQRVTKVDFSDDENVQTLKTIENNIAQSVIQMRDSGYNKAQIINYLIEMLVTGDKSFENVARNMMGKDSTETKPSVLDHYSTSLRDPLFWIINNHIVSLIDKALEVVPAYTRNELYFPGIVILDIVVKKMSTSFDLYQIDVTDALKSSKSDKAYEVKIEQPRLNHKPFTLKLNISSLVAQKGLVKLYLGPKVAPGEQTTNKNMFMFLDSFEYSFKTGLNTVTRSSDAMFNFSGDFDSLKVLRKKVEDAEFGLDAMPFENIDRLTNIPSRLMLPKGTPEGLPLQIFAFVAPFTKLSSTTLYSLTKLELNSAVLSPGYPFDLNVQDFNIFTLPNAMVKDVAVTHKAEKVSDGSAKKWKDGSDSYDPSNKKPYDYTSKKGQYENTEQFSTKSANSVQAKQIEDKKIEITTSRVKLTNDKTTEEPATRKFVIENSLDEEKEIETTTAEDLNTLYSQYLDEVAKIKSKLEEISKSSDDKIDMIENNLDTLRPSQQDVEDRTLPPPSHLPSLLMKRTPTVYDYLLPTFHYDDDTDTDDKVYYYY